jgi:hypothetical protein
VPGKAWHGNRNIRVDAALKWIRFAVLNDPRCVPKGTPNEINALRAHAPGNSSAIADAESTAMPPKSREISARPCHRRQTIRGARRLGYRNKKGPALLVNISQKAAAMGHMLERPYTQGARSASAAHMDASGETFTRADPPGQGKDGQKNPARRPEKPNIKRSGKHSAKSPAWCP